MVFKCKHCGSTMLFEKGSLHCECGNSDYDVVDNTSDMTCDICGSVLKSNRLAQVCENCGANVVSSNTKLYKDSIALPIIGLEDAKKQVKEFISQVSMSPNIKNLKVELLYLPYSLVDTKKGKDNFPVYMGSLKLCKYGPKLFKPVKVKYLRKMASELLAGSESFIGEEREQVITKLVMNSIGDDIPKSKMSALLPVYRLINGSDTYFVNGLTGAVFGEIKQSKAKLFKLSMLEAVALTGLVSTFIIWSGGLMR